MPLLTKEELRDRIARLAAIDRPSASPGERRAAEMIADELESLGARARIEEERAHGTYWWPLGIATGVAALAGVVRSRLGGLVGLAAAALVWDDIRIGPRFLRRLLPQRPTANVVAEMGNAEAGRTVLLVSHHDAAHTGLVFHPELPRAVMRRFPRLAERAKTTPPTMWPAAGGPLLVAVGGLLGLRLLRRAGAVISAGNALAMADVGSSRVVPGANDNLSGVGVVLSVASALRDEPVDDVRVILLSTGSEESFSEGMEAFARRHLRSMPRESTYVICVDTVGSPHLLLLEGEGMLGVKDYPENLLNLVRDCADRVDVPLWPGLRFRNATDAFTALRLGYPAAMIGSVDDYKFPTDYHWPTDTPDRVNFHTVSDAAKLCLEVVRRLGEGPPDADAPDGEGVRREHAPVRRGGRGDGQPPSTSRT